jgi:photosystem II stability/assembly factor-like uncharacterized protein
MLSRRIGHGEDAGRSTGMALGSSVPKKMRWGLALAALAGLGGLACDVVAPPPPPPPDPDPGWVVSKPFSDIRVLNDVLVLAPGVAWAVGSGGSILRLEGETWAREDSGVDVDLESIDGFIDGEGVEHLYAVGHAGTILSRSADGGWEILPSGTTRLLFSVAVRRRDDVFVVGEAGTVLRFDGTAVSLQTQQTLQLVVGADGSQNFFPIPEALKAVGVAGDGMLAVGARGAVYRYDPNGEPAGTSNRWVREDSGTTRSLAGIFTRAGTWVPTTDGVLMFRNGPGAWDDDSVRTPAPVFLQDVYVDGNIFAVGLSEDISHRNDRGEWLLTRVALGAELRGIDGTRVEPTAEGEPPGREVIAVGGGGRIVRGPSFQPAAGETLLVTRSADDDFL